MARLSHYPEGWRVVEDEVFKNEKGLDEKRVKVLHCLAFTSHHDAIAYMNLVHPDVTINLKCDCCGQPKAVSPEPVGSSFLLSCKSCIWLGTSVKPKSDAETGKPLKHPRPGVKETELEVLVETLRDLDRAEATHTGHAPLDAKLADLRVGVYTPPAARLSKKEAKQLADFRDVLLQRHHGTRPQYLADNKLSVPKEDAPEECNLCDHRITESYVDGVVRGSGWSYMCNKCHAEWGIGLGTGRGQRYVKDGDRYVKVEG